MKSTASLAILVGDSLGRARRGIAPLAPGAAPAGTVGIRQALPGNKLLPIALAHILGASLVARSTIVVAATIVAVIVLLPLLAAAIAIASETTALLTLGKRHGRPGAHGVAAD